MEVERIWGKKKFDEKVIKRCDGYGNWGSLRRKLLDVAREACGQTKGN